jgi:formylglycine-generating enzyme required for sulfatase activity
VYRIGKYEISEQMIDKANALGGLGLHKSSRGPNKPVTNISWFESARFANWLNTSTGYPPAYKFGTSGQQLLWELGEPGYDASNPYRNRRAMYFLPSANEWYKAAYYAPTSATYFDYPTGSNSPPTAVASGSDEGTAVYGQDFFTGPADITFAGGLSPHGTVAQGGNVSEWEETRLDLATISSNHAVRGGAWVSSDVELQATSRFAQMYFPPSQIGFRVASFVPEPNATALVGVALVGILGFKTRVTLPSVS